MPDLSLRIDENNLQKLKIAASREHLSVSDYAAKKLVELMNDEWPKDFTELFGSVNDDTFEAQPGDICCADIAREDL